MLSVAAPTVWTGRRKWLGNLIPVLFWLPLTIAGIVVIVKSGEASPLGIGLLGAATVVGWLALNQFGLYENGRMKGQLARIIIARGDVGPEAHWFVGFATPRYSSALDAHEDVGFLWMEPDRVKFVSEVRTVEVARADVTEVRFRPNVHSLLFLGRWVAIEATVAGKPIRLTVEPRVDRTLLVNRRLSNELLARLEEWRKGPTTGPA